MGRPTRKSLWLFITALNPLVIGMAAADMWVDAFVEGFNSLRIVQVTSATFLVFAMLLGAVSCWREVRRGTYPPRIKGTRIFAVLALGVVLLSGSMLAERWGAAVTTGFSVQTTVEALSTSLISIVLVLYAPAIWMLRDKPQRKAREEPLIWTP
jgi:hypothetical protein